MELTYEFDEETLAHYGVKGMKWGRRKQRPISSRTNRRASVSEKLRKAGRTARVIAKDPNMQKAALKLGASVAVGIGLGAVASMGSAAVMAYAVGSSPAIAAASAGKAAVAAKVIGTRLAVTLAAKPINKAVGKGIDKVYDPKRKAARLDKKQDKVWKKGMKAHDEFENTMAGFNKKGTKHITSARKLEKIQNRAEKKLKKTEEKYMRLDEKAAKKGYVSFH